MIHTEASIISNRRITEGYWRMNLDASQIASEAKPGQFIHVRIGGNNFPLLRRPFSVFRCIKSGDGIPAIEVVYKIVGRGTKLMSTLKKGGKLDIIGPLGHGFEVNRDKKSHVLLGGGMGSVCLFMLGEEISRVAMENRLELYILLGAETKKRLILKNEFAALNGTMLVSTDDGTSGYKGYVTEMLKNEIDKGKISSDCAIYACGPEPMLKTLASFCQSYHIPAQVSIERKMICGIGACLACICKVDKTGVTKHRDLKSSHIQLSLEEPFGYGLVCADGPVFNIDEVIFDE